MKNGFVKCGPVRFARGKESDLWKSIQEKHAEELATASLLKKLRIQFQMLREFLCRRKAGHEPSAKTLW